MQSFWRRVKILNFTKWAFLSWLCVFTVLPFLIILTLSFLSKDSQGSLVWNLSFSNYVRCFDWIYIKVFGKTILLALGATLACLMVGYPVAHFLATQKGIGKQLGLILLFIPFWTNFILRIHAIVSVLGNHGLLNQGLLSLGLINQPLEILYTRVGVFLGLLYNYLPFLVVPVFTALEKLDPSLKEAAYDLGAHPLQVFTRVIFPNIKEGVFTGCLFVFIPMIGEYVIPDILGGGKEVFLGNIMVSQFYTLQDWPFGSSIAGLLSILMLFTLWLNTHWSKTKAKQEAVLKQSEERLEFAT
jgi:spermidine/putrescine transport system permease protein